MKGVKGDADREDNLQDSDLLGADGGKHFVEGFGGEHVVLEECEEAEVRHDAGGHGEFVFALGGARSRDDLAPEEIQDGGEEHQPREPRFPPTVKEIAAEGDPDVPPAIRKVVINEQKERQKIENENLTREDHELIARQHGQHQCDFQANLDWQSDREATDSTG